MGIGRNLGIITLAVCMYVVVPHAALGQANAGIAGQVEDSTGGALPGVTVEVASPALIEQVRIAVTDGSGNYRITALPPGEYSVTFSLAGFSSVRREGIELSGDFTAPVDAELAVGSIEETVTVSGAAPIVDVQSARTQQVLRDDILNLLPSAMKDLTQLASLTLGAMPSSGNRNDVGGDKGSQSTGISIHGSRGDDGRVSWDGHNTNVFFGGSGGQQTTYSFNTVGVSEQVVDMAGNSARTETGGANVNMVPREGANVFSAMGTVAYTDSKFSSSSVPSSLVSRGSPDEVTSLKKIYDTGLGIGGPIVQDRAWFFSANRVWGAQTFGGANNFFNKSQNFYEYVPDRDRPVYSDTYFRDFGGRVTLQATEKQKVALTLHYQRGCRCWQGISASAAPEAQYSFFYTPHYVLQGSWTYPATNRLLMQAGTGYMYQGVEFSSFGGPDAPGQRRITNINDPERGTYIWGGTYGGIVFNDNGERQRNDTVTYFARTSYITGSMDLEIGVDGQWGMFNQRGNPLPADGYDYIFSAGLPLLITQNSGPFRSDGRVAKFGTYASLRYTADRLTFTGALRYDQHHTRALAIDVPAGPFISERSYDAANDLPNYKDISPRIGAAYDLFGDGKTALRGSWGRYLVGLGAGALSQQSPSNAVVAGAGRLWFDNPSGGASPFNFFNGNVGNSDFMPDCDLTNFAPNGECGPINAGGFGLSTPSVFWDDNARRGWGVREFNYQWSVNLQHEVRPGFGVSFGYYHTEFHNTQIRVNTALSASDFDTYCVTAPTDPLLGSASGQQVCGNLDRTLASLGIAPTNVWYRIEDAPVPGLDGRYKDTYDGVELSMNLRFGDGGLLMGGLSLGRKATDRCFANDFPQITGIVQQAGAGGASGIGTQRDDAFCTNKAQGLWDAQGSQVKFQAVYPLPYDFVISGTFKHLPGNPRSADVVYTNDQIRTSLGRNLSSCGTVTGPCGDVEEVGVTFPGELYDERLTQVDLRLQRRFPVGPGIVSAVFELYNVFNERAPQGQLDTWGAAPSAPNASFNQPTILLGGRLMKFGMQLQF